ncbi:MAG: VacJ family lipoprotein [Alphaproteobacteria bacterium]|nr:VacJ family lipoprotein [Alphaproteobacteria bacterium]
MRIPRTIIAAILTGFALAGCATMPADGPQDLNDPLEGWNRLMFNVTLAVDKGVYRPTAIVYRRTLPQPVRNSFRNFLNNLNSPVIFANDMLQGEADRARITFMRASINTTFGVGGLFDIATRYGLQRHDEDLGQTLGAYGVGEGPYIFIPLLGPGNPRDILGRLTDIFFDPLSYVQWGDKNYLPYVRFGVDYIDIRERNIETLDEVEATSLDYYASVRSLYRQTRVNEINNGASAVQDLPDF